MAALIATIWLKLKVDHIMISRLLGLKLVLIFRLTNAGRITQPIIVVIRENNGDRAINSPYFPSTVLIHNQRDRKKCFCTSPKLIPANNLLKSYFKNS